MPAKTPKMQRFMAGCLHSPQHMKGTCPSPQVAKEFSHKPAGGYSGKRKSSGS